MLDYRTHTFLEVYRQRSFTQAARSLMITQPAVSQHIKQLESHYGCPLFVKTGRGIEPTPAATVLYQRLLTMENDDARLVAEVGRLTAAPTKAREAPLKLGCTRTIADFMAPQLVAAHLVRHPNSPVTLRAGNTRDLVGALDRGDIDFALVEGSLTASALTTRFSRTSRISPLPAERTPKKSSLVGRAPKPRLPTQQAPSRTPPARGSMLASPDPAPFVTFSASASFCERLGRARARFWKTPGGARSRRDGFCGDRRARKHPHHQSVRARRHRGHVHVSGGRGRRALSRGARGYHARRLLNRARLLPHLATGQPIRTTISSPLQSVARPAVSPSCRR